MPSCLFRPPDSTRVASYGRTWLEEGLCVYLILNTFWGPLDFELPMVGVRPRPWRRWIDTSLESLHDIVPWDTAPSVPDQSYRAGSYGGRQASMLLAAEPARASTLLLQSYPLHPPGRPRELRIAHLPDLRVPTLFVSGTTDPFGSPAELEIGQK